MALDYSKSFYNSNEWKKISKYIRNKYNHTCQECGDYGSEVHHINEITPLNINDYNVILNENNLTLLCKACHNKKKTKISDVNKGLTFTKEGDLIQIPPINDEMR